MKGPTWSQWGSAAQPDVQTAGAGTVSAETMVSTPRGLGAGVLAPLQFINYLGLLLADLCAHPQAASDLWWPALQRLYLEGHFLSWNHASRSRPSPVKCLAGFWGKTVFSDIKYFYDLAATCAQLLSCVRLCDPMDCSPPASSDRGILQARKLEWAVISFSRGSSPPGDWPRVSRVFCTGRQTPYHCTMTRSTTYQQFHVLALSGAAVEPPDGGAWCGLWERVSPPGRSQLQCRAGRPSRGSRRSAQLHPGVCRGPV